MDLQLGLGWRQDKVGTKREPWSKLAQRRVVGAVEALRRVQASLDRAITWLSKANHYESD